MHISDLSISPHVLHTLQCEAAELVMDRMVRRPEALAVLRPQSNPPAAEVFFNTKVSVQFARRSGHECSAAPAHPAICDRCAAEGQEEATRRGRCASCADPMGCPSCVGKPMECPSCGQAFVRQWAYETGSGRSSIGRDIKR